MVSRREIDFVMRTAHARPMAAYDVERIAILHVPFHLLLLLLLLVVLFACSD